MLTKLLHFEVDKQLIESNRIELADTIRLLVYQTAPVWFERLSYDNDLIFLEPSLFYHFSEKSTLTIEIEQLLFGYLQTTDRPSKFKVLSDPFGKIYLPNFGVFATDMRCSSVELIYDHEANRLSYGNDKDASFVGSLDPLKKNLTCTHLPFILFTEQGQLSSFVESPSLTLSAYRSALDKAIHIMTQSLPEVWQVFQHVLREVSVFNSTNLRSMAAISHYGTAFLNTEGQLHDEVFFIEDLAHQCGHIVFYSLTLHANNFLRINKETPMYIITGIQHDIRSVYGAFHGLFTYTTILYCLTKCINLGVFSPAQTNEGIARIGFFMRKFALDLGNMDKPEIFTTMGRQFYDAFRAGFDELKNEFESHYKALRYDNQPYIFNYSLFKEINEVLIYE